MKTNELLHKIGSILFIFVGLGHTSGANFFTSPFVTVSGGNAVLQAVQNNSFNMFGLEVSILNAFNGLSYSFGMMVLFYGLMNLLVARNNVDVVLKDKYIPLLNILMALVMTIIWGAFFFILPFGEMIVALICFTGAYVLKDK